MIKKGFEQTPKNPFPRTNKPTEQIIFFFKSSVILTHPRDVEKKNTLKNSSLATLFSPNRKKKRKKKKKREIMFCFFVVMEELGTKNGFVGRLVPNDTS
jgi:hypothetical protein